MEVHRKQQEEKWLQSHGKHDKNKLYQKGFDHRVLGCGDLINRQGQKILIETLKEKCVCLYFSADWVKSSKEFTSLLENAYSEYNSMRHADESKTLEIVYVSFDETEEDMFKFMKDTQMPWLAIPFHDKIRKDDLMGKFHVSNLPKLVIVDSKGNNLTSSFEDSVIIDLITRNGSQALSEIISGV